MKLLENKQRGKVKKSFTMDMISLLWKIPKFFWRLLPINVRKVVGVFVFANIFFYFVIPEVYYIFWDGVHAVSEELVERKTHSITKRKYGRTVADMRKLGGKDCWGWVKDIGDWHK